MTEQDQAESFARAVRAMRPGNALAADGESGRQPFGMKYGGPVPVRPGSALGVPVCRELFGVQLGSRHLDLAARWLRERDRGYYTIGSSGHEGNAGLAAALRVTDPALLHYRSGAFYLTRACQAGRSADALHGGLRAVLLGPVAAAAEPIAGGRHKVFGRAELAIIPQTSTIASHLARAVRPAFAAERRHPPA